MFLTEKLRTLGRTISEEGRLVLKVEDKDILRLLNKVVGYSDSCWDWQGSLNRGYAQCWLRGTKQAHRVFYQLFKGPIPRLLDVDHVCRNKRCVNPEHLEAVTRSENIIRALPWKPKSVDLFKKLRCVRGHVFSLKNTRLRYENEKIWRVCIKCTKHHSALYRSRQV